MGEHMERLSRLPRVKIFATDSSPTVKKPQADGMSLMPGEIGSAR
ncbi:MULTISPECIES: hypothetical protein [unclassified Rhizobium]|nr:MULTISPECIES: hypothetical protein [unclassified Rhizobium]